MSMIEQKRNRHSETMKKYVAYGNFNKPKKKPFRTKTRIIYKAVNKLATFAGRFLPTWDDTDHFHFVCMNCHGVADVLQVDFIPKYANVGEALFFHLGCSNCGRTGQRKIYLKMRDNSCSHQHTFTFDNKELTYGKKRTPCSEVQLEQVKIRKG